MAVSDLSQQRLCGCSASPMLGDVAPSTSNVGQAERDSSMGAEGGWEINRELCCSAGIENALSY